MRRVLLVKMSSLGDVVHALAAVTEAKDHCPDLVFDWVVEEAFADIPAMHPAVDRVIPVAFRRLRKKKLAMFSDPEWERFTTLLRERDYDLVIDAQGLIKSAWVSRLARGALHGFGWRSARESIVALAYSKRYSVDRGQHAITRLRQLFAQVFDYAPEAEFPGYGLVNAGVSVDEGDKPYVFFLIGTTWPSKQWPDKYWTQLINLANKQGYKVLLTAGNFEEMARVRLISDKADSARVLPKMNIEHLALYLGNAEAVIGVDTGLSHLAAALDVPGVTIYGSTSSQKTGVVGTSHKNLDATFECAPCLKRECMYKGSSTVFPACYESLSPEIVWESVLQLFPEKG
jgi:heptosyltransferase-1